MDKRIGHLAMALQFGATVYDLEESELCYAPPFGSAKDPRSTGCAARPSAPTTPRARWSSTGSPQR
ncbi:MAG: hypothetical protein WCF36_19860 [Candidatus Nanopelagicales bacterium]